MVNFFIKISKNKNIRSSIFSKQTVLIYLFLSSHLWEFPPEKLKELYYMRWSIESAFRQLKYAVGMMHFHAKKVEYIKQKIFAKLIVYNFSEIIASQASISKNSKKKKKHNYKLNYSMAAKICHKLLKQPVSAPPLDVISWIQWLAKWHY